MTGLLIAGGALLMLGASAAAYFLLLRPDGLWGRALSAYEARLDRHCSFLLLERESSELVRWQLLMVSACVGLLFITRHFAFAILSGLAVFGPPMWLWRRHAARVGKLERQLDTWLLMLANALKSTPSLGEAVASTAALVPRPFSEEVDLLVKELRLGVPLDRALNAAATRVGSPVISGAVMMIVVARQTGGDLSATLERASAVLREAARLEGVLRTKTAEGRGQVLVLALVPFVLCIIIGSLDRAWFDPMLDDPHGRGILVACGLAWLAATLWAHQIAGTEL